MANRTALDREEYIEQGYFFRVLRERVAQNRATQDVLTQVGEEILATTRLPLAIGFLATELKHSGLLSSGFARLPHYFTAFQTFLLRQTEDETRRFGFDAALVVLQREAEFRTDNPTPQGLFVYQVEVLSRNRLGYEDGLRAMQDEALYDDAWREYIDVVRQQLGSVEFADLIYRRSELAAADRRRSVPDYEPVRRPLFGEKEGRIARANLGKDPLFLFAALQRQLGYPEVPRPVAGEDVHATLKDTQVKLRDLEQRLRLLESEVRGQIDLAEFGKPDILNTPWPKDED